MFHEYGNTKVMDEAYKNIEGVVVKKANRNIFVAKIKGDKGTKDREGTPVLCT